MARNKLEHVPRQIVAVAEERRTVGVGGERHNSQDVAHVRLREPATGCAVCLELTKPKPDLLLHAHASGRRQHHCWLWHMVLVSTAASATAAVTAVVGQRQRACRVVSGVVRLGAREPRAGVLARSRCVHTLVELEGASARERGAATTASVRHRAAALVLGTVEHARVIARTTLVRVSTYVPIRTSSPGLNAPLLRSAGGRTALTRRASRRSEPPRRVPWRMVGSGARGKRSRYQR